MGHPQATVEATASSGRRSVIATARTVSQLRSGTEVPLFDSGDHTVDDDVLSSLDSTKGKSMPMLPQANSSAPEFGAHGSSGDPLRTFCQKCQGTRQRGLFGVSGFNL